MSSQGIQSAEIMGTPGSSDAWRGLITCLGVGGIRQDPSWYNEGDPQGEPGPRRLQGPRRLLDVAPPCQVLT